MLNDNVFQFKEQSNNLPDVINKYINCGLSSDKLMTLDEAIEHCLEKSNDTPCGREHRQLAEWLKELKSYREKIYIPLS